MGEECERWGMFGGSGILGGSGMFDGWWMFGCGGMVGGPGMFDG